MEEETPFTTLLQPQGYFDDVATLLLAEREDAMTGAGWFMRSSQAAVSYNWALIQNFSKYYALAVPLIDQSSRLSDNPRSGVIPVSLAGYMSSLRGVCLSNTKYELKFHIL